MSKKRSSLEFNEPLAATPETPDVGSTSKRDSISDLEDDNYELQKPDTSISEILKNNPSNSSTNNNITPKNSNNNNNNLKRPSSKNHRRNYSVPSMPIINDNMNNITNNLNKNRRPSLTDHSSLAVLNFLKNDLNDSQKKKMRKLSTDLKIERDLKHLKIKLSEIEEERDTAVEIMGNLTKENEEYEMMIETLKMNLQQYTTENKILQSTIKSIQDTYKEDLNQKDYDLKEANQQIADLKETIEHDEQIIKQQTAREEQMNKQIQKSNNNNDDNDNDISSIDNIKKIQNENKKLKNLLNIELKKNKDKDDKIDRLLDKLQEFNTISLENEKLKKDLSQLSNMAEQDLKTQDLSRKRLEEEIMKLASINSQLERDKEDLYEVLEQRDYEAEMLKQQLEFTKYNSKNDTSTNDQPNTPSLNNNNSGNNMFNDLQNDLNNYDDQYQDYEYNEDEIDNQQQQQINDEQKEKEKDNKYRIKKESRKIPDIQREYLHIAATAILIKHPKVTNIESSQLIQKVKNYPFEDFYDQMLKIVKFEEKKQNEANRLKHSNKDTKKPGALFGFLSKFGRNKKKSPTSSINEKNTTINGTQMKTRTTSRSVTVQRKKDIIVNRTNNDDNKKNDDTKDNSSKVDNFIFGNKNKEKKVKDLASKDFVGVDALGMDKNKKKVTKPGQAL